MFFFFFLIVTAASVANGFVTPRTTAPSMITSTVTMRFALDSDTTSFSTTYEKDMMEMRKDLVHMGVTPRRAFRGALLRPVGTLAWPWLLMWLIARDTADLLVEKYSSGDCERDTDRQDTGGSLAFHAIFNIATTAFRVATRVPMAVLAGSFNSIGAAVALSDTNNRAAKYAFFTMPWWIRNRLRPQNGVDADLHFFRLLTADRTLLDFIESHMYLRYKARDFLANNTIESRCAHIATTNAELSIAGGSIITQYILFGDDIFEDPEDHELVSAAAHVLDDFNDETVDEQTGNLNHFIHHLGSTVTEEEKCKHAEQWVRIMYNVHCRHEETPFGRFIRGTMFYLCNTEDRLRNVIETMNDREDACNRIPLPKLTLRDIEW